MRRFQILFRVPVAGVVLALVGLAGAAAEETTTVFTDRSRIASIGGSVTEIVYALGQENSLVARDSTSVFPEAATRLPDVGYMRALSAEGVLSVNPSGLLVLQGSGPVETIDVLKKASIPLVMVPDSYDDAGILEKIRVVGRAMGAEEGAAALSAKVRADLVAAERLTAGISERKRVLFVLSVQAGKLMAAGSNTAADGIIRLAGAVNAVEGYAGYKQLSDEAAILARPDVILMMDRDGGRDTSDAELFAHPAIASTPAGQTRNVVRLEANYLLGFGPRTAAAIRDLAVALYGDALKG